MGGIVEQAAVSGGALLHGAWLKLTSASLMRLEAPVIGVLLVLLGRALWLKAERTALGRVTRWWTLAILLTPLAAGVLFVLSVLPEDPEALAALREGPERFGRALFPAPIAALGGVAVAVAAVAAAWQWRQFRTSTAERAAQAAAWRAVRARWLRRGSLLLAVLLAAIVTACAAAAAAPAQVPPLAAGGAGGGTAVLWVGTGVGLSRLAPSPGGGAWEALLQPRVPLPGGRVNSLAVGPGGTLWLGTTRGAMRYTGGQVEAFTPENSTLPNSQVLGVALDRRGLVWAATGAGGAGIDTRPQGRAGRTFTDVNAPLLHNILDTAYVDARGRIWFGGAGGVNVFEPPADDTGAGTWPVGFTRYSTSGGLPDDLVWVVYGDSRGRIWFGTPAGAAVLTVADDVQTLGALDAARWQTFTTRSSPLANDRVHAIMEDAQGRIWLGTEGGASVVPAGEREGDSVPLTGWQQHRAGGTGVAGAAGTVGTSGTGPLPHPFVQALALGPDGRVWAGTVRGLAVYDPARAGEGWRSYHANALKRWTGYLWPAFWRQNVISDDVTALAWSHE